jgi:hypothetical protein
MANIPAGQIAWRKASELHLVHEESRLNALELPRLKSLIPNGLQRGSLIEITGDKSSGKTAISLYILAESIRNGETCAYIDLKNQLDFKTFPQRGVPLSQLSWVRCHGNTEHAIRCTDLILHAGGFGIVLLDLCGASSQDLNHIPISYWFRFRRAIENTPTILLICSESPQARSCSRHSFEIKPRKFHWTGESPFVLFDGMESEATPRKAAPSKLTTIRPEYLMIQTPRLETVEG